MTAHPYIGLRVVIKPIIEGTATSGSTRPGMEGYIVHVHDGGVVLLTPWGRHELVPYERLTFDAATVAHLEAQWGGATTSPPSQTGVAWPPRPTGHSGTWTREQWAAMVAVAPTLSALAVFVDMDVKTVNKELRRHKVSAPWARPRPSTGST